MKASLPGLPWSSPALRLTLGVWTLCLLTQSTRLLAWRAGFPPWSAPFFLLILLTGTTLSLVLLWGLTVSRGRFRRWRWPMIALLTFAVALAQSIIDHATYRTLLPLFGEQVAPYFELDGVALNLNNYLWLYGLYTVAIELIASVERAAEARGLAQQAQLRALRFQLNPHFLFNTLNVISGLIVSARTREAETMLVKLSDFLRASLGKEEGVLTDLIAELGMVEAYLDIEAVRFGPAFGVRIDCPEHLYFAQVPAFILQPLVENAVKYAVAPSGGGSDIAICVRDEANRLVINVTDRGAPESTAIEGHGVGLANIRARLAALYGQAAALHLEGSDLGFTARIELPLEVEPMAKAG